MTAGPTFKRVFYYMLGFELLTIPAGIWGWKSGLPFWQIMPGAVLCGMTGGAFLSVAVYSIRTGYMQRGFSSYRFTERPAMFVMDAIMVLLAIILSLSWPIGYSMQELAKIKTDRNQDAAPKNDFHPGR